MFIETLEFTIPMDLCDLFSTLKRGPRANLEFPASVNSYGTTQDANIQVVVRSNKLTFKVDGVSSDASMISKSECKTLKLAVFDVDRTLMPSEEETYESDMSMQFSSHMATPVSAPSSQMSSATKRLHEQSVSLPPAKNSRTSYSDSPRPRSPKNRHFQPHPQHQTNSRPSENSKSKPHNDTPVNVKQEPEDPDLIEIEPDPEPDDIVPKKETPYMQIDYSSDVPHTQTSQAALERLSHPHSSHSQSPASSSSSFHQNVPHVQDYSEPGPRQMHHGDQSADDFLVFQDDDDGGEDNEADYSNDGLGLVFAPLHSNQGPDFASQSNPGPSFASQSNPGLGFQSLALPTYANSMQGRTSEVSQTSRKKPSSCDICGKAFTTSWVLRRHKESAHEHKTYLCPCGKVYNYLSGLQRHQKDCFVYIRQQIGVGND